MIIDRNSKNYFLLSSTSISTKRINVFDILVFAQVFLCFSTLLSGLSSLFSILNRVLFGVYIILLLLVIIKHFKKSSFSSTTILLLAFFITIIGISLTLPSFYSFNDVVYLPLWCLNLILASICYKDVKSSLLKNHSLLFRAAVIWIIIVSLSLFYPSSYINHSTGTFFVSFSGQQHRFSQTGLFIILCLLLEYFITKNKFVFLLLVLPLFTIFICGARAYIVIIFMMVIFLLFISIKNRVGRFLLLLMGGFFVVYVGYYVTTSRFYTDSYYYVVNSTSLLNFVTSGRTTFWKIDLDHFFNGNVFNIIFGNGYNFVYDTNEQFYGSKLWAHNDYIQVLLANGFIGLFVYFWSFFFFLKTALKMSKARFISVIFFLIIIGFNAMFNMVYTYAIANVSTPIIGMILLDFSRTQKSLGTSAIKLGF